MARCSCSPERIPIFSNAKDTLLDAYVLAGRSLLVYSSVRCVNCTGTELSVIADLRTGRVLRAFDGYTPTWADASRGLATLATSDSAVLADADGRVLEEVNSGDTYNTFPLAGRIAMLECRRTDRCMLVWYADTDAGSFAVLDGIYDATVAVMLYTDRPDEGVLVVKSVPPRDEPSLTAYRVRVSGGSVRVVGAHDLKYLAYALMHGHLRLSEIGLVACDRARLAIVDPLLEYAEYDDGAVELTVSVRYSIIDLSGDRPLPVRQYTELSYGLKVYADMDEDPEMVVPGVAINNMSLNPSGCTAEVYAELSGFKSDGSRMTVQLVADLGSDRPRISPTFVGFSGKPALYSCSPHVLCTLHYDGAVSPANCIPGTSSTIR